MNDPDASSPAGNSIPYVQLEVNENNIFKDSILKISNRQRNDHHNQPQTASLEMLLFIHFTYSTTVLSCPVLKTEYGNLSIPKHAAE